MRRTRITASIGFTAVSAFLVLLSFSPLAEGETKSNHDLIQRVDPNAPSRVIEAIPITTLGAPITQNFDTLPASGTATWTNNSTIPGWYHARTGTGTTILADDGNGTAGNLYSYGIGTNVERALGSIGSGGASAGNLSRNC